MRLFPRKRTCQSWRFVIVDGHDRHTEPGACRECWRGCTNVIGKEQWAQGSRRCAECVESLVTCPLVDVRRALVREKALPKSVLQVLQSDPNGTISSKAMRRLEEMGPRDDPNAVVVLRTRRQLREATPAPEPERPATTTPTRPSVWGD